VSARAAHPQISSSISGRPPLSEPDLARSALYSEELGIRLRDGSERELFKWFLASLLFGGRISETIARNTYRAFVRHRLLTARAILRAGHDTLVYPVMHEGGYVRYDESKSTQIARDCQMLAAEYQGRLTRLHATASGPADLEERLQRFYGVGAITANIFLRELRPFWSKADPEPLAPVRDLARAWGIDLARHDRKSLAFARLEAGLVRALHRQDYVRKRAVAHASRTRVTARGAPA